MIDHTAMVLICVRSPDLDCNKLIKSSRFRSRIGGVCPGVQVPVEIGKLPVIELFNIEENKACKAPPPEVKASISAAHKQRAEGASAASDLGGAGCTVNCFAGPDALTRVTRPWTQVIAKGSSTVLHFFRGFLKVGRGPAPLSQRLAGPRSTRARIAPYPVDPCRAAHSETF
jgi:hypothetical protein